MTRTVSISSTSEVYGDPECIRGRNVLGHVNPIGPRGVYDEAKRYAEALTMTYRPAGGCMIARTSTRDY
jgi:dTDP-glucose 4,6-dehydratase